MTGGSSIWAMMRMRPSQTGQDSTSTPKTRIMRAAEAAEPPEQVTEALPPLLAQVRWRRGEALEGGGEGKALGASGAAAGCGAGRL